MSGGQNEFYQNYFHLEKLGTNVRTEFIAV